MINSFQIWIIDDNDIDSYIHSRLIQLTFHTAKISLFNSAQKALENLENAQNPLPELIFLDLNMPLLDGWGFLEQLKRIINLKEYLPNIYLLTSSLDNNDQKKAEANDLVKSFITKPLTLENIQKIKKLDFSEFLEVNAFTSEKALSLKAVNE
jgi:CheY-like chemotaxis protein